MTEELGGTAFVPAPRVNSASAQRNEGL